MVITEDYKYLLADFTVDKITSRFESLLIQIQAVLEKLEIIDKVEVNLELLELAVLDYFEDIARLKYFHNIPRVNVQKIYSYGAFWLLRRSPVQIVDKSIPANYLHINEKICVAITIPKMLAELGLNANCAPTQIQGFLDLIFYNFKFRNYNQQSLELMIEAFFCGCRCFSQESDSMDNKSV